MVFSNHGGYGEADDVLPLAGQKHGAERWSALTIAGWAHHSATYQLRKREGRCVRIDFVAASIISFGSLVLEMTMPKAVIVMICLGLLALSSCANTVRGFRQDSTQTGLAVEGATDGVLRAGAQ